MRSTISSRRSKVSLGDAYRKRRTGIVAAETFDTLTGIENYFQGGKNWGQGDYHMPDGRKCLVGAAEVMGPRGREAQHWLRHAIEEKAPGIGTIEGFNDSRKGFEPIAEVLTRAKQLAATCAIESAKVSGKLPAPTPQARLPARAAPVVLAITHQPIIQHQLNAPDRVRR
jgi:hypothetical protein